MDPARARSLTHSLTPTDRDRDSPHSRDRPTPPAGRRRQRHVGGVLNSTHSLEAVEEVALTANNPLDAGPQDSQAARARRGPDHPSSTTRVRRTRPRSCTQPAFKTRSRYSRASGICTQGDFQGGVAAHAPADLAGPRRACEQRAGSPSLTPTSTSDPRHASGFSARCEHVGQCLLHGVGAVHGNVERQVRRQATQEARAPPLEHQALDHAERRRGPEGRMPLRSNPGPARGHSPHVSASGRVCFSHTLEPRLAQVMARLDVQHAHDPDEPFVSGGHALLEGLTPEERRSLLDQAPPCAAAPPAAAVEAPPIGGALSFRSRSGTATISRPSKGRGHKRPRAAGDVGVAGKTGAGTKAPSGPLSFSFGEGDE